MHYKQLGDTALKVSQVSLGTWAIGSDYFGKVNDADSIAAIQASLDAGVNLIDTSPAYGADGHAERVVGKAIKGRRKEAIICTKVGTVRLPGKFVRDLRPESIRTELDASLKRLDTDHIDIYLLHWPDDNVPLEETAQTLAELKKTGKFKHFGVSNFSLEQIDIISRYLPVEVLQPQYSILVQDKAELIQQAHQRGIGVMSYGSLAGGILTGKFSAPPAFETDDTRSNFYPFFKQPLWDKTQQFISQLRELSESLNHPIAEVAINYAAQNAFVSTALVGAKNAAQAAANAAATSWELSAEARATIDRFVKKIFSTPD